MFDKIGSETLQLPGYRKYDECHRQHYGQRHRHHRHIVLWIPDWSLAAIEILSDSDTPVAVAANNCIVAFNRCANRAGVQVGMSKREARYSCPGLQIGAYDVDWFNSAFETVVNSFEKHAANVQVIYPGLAWASASVDPASIAGIEPEGKQDGQQDDCAQHLAHNVRSQIADEIGVEAWCGIASLPIAAFLAARKNQVIPLSQTRNFLFQADLKQILTILPPNLRTQLKPVIAKLRELKIRTVAQLYELKTHKFSDKNNAHGRYIDNNIGEDSGYIGKDNGYAGKDSDCIGKGGGCVGKSGDYIGKDSDNNETDCEDNIGCDNQNFGAARGKYRWNSQNQQICWELLTGQRPLLAEIERQTTLASVSHQVTSLVTSRAEILNEGRLASLALTGALSKYSNVSNSVSLANSLNTLRISIETGEGVIK